MNFIDKTQKMHYLIELINHERTGTPDELAQRLCVSRRTLFRLLDDLHLLGNKNSFCRKRQTYYFYA
jgi:predicted DNA-binding transcriptional regulator YafY